MFWSCINDWRVLFSCQPRKKAQILLKQILKSYCLYLYQEGWSKNFFSGRTTKEYKYLFLKLNKRLPDGELTAVPLSTLPWWPSRLFWGRPGASSKHQAPANRSSSSFILLPFHRQLDPRATIQSSIESLD